MVMMSGQSATKIHAHELYGIMFQMSTADVVRCMQVCKYWKVQTNDCL